MHRQAFLLAAGGALASCSQPTSSLVTPMRALLRPKSTCVPSVQYDPKSGVLWAYGCTTTGLSAGGTAQFYTAANGDFKFRWLPFDNSFAPFFLDLNNPVWNEARLIKIYDRWLSTQDWQNNRVTYLSHDQSTILSDAAFDPDSLTMTANQYQPAPKQTYQNAYQPSFRRDHSHLDPHTCHSAKLLFAAASLSALIGLCTTELGIGLVFIGIAGMLAIAGSGDDMLAQCKR